MKTIFKIGLLVATALSLLFSCQKEKPMKWVDLRYKADDSYNVDAAGTIPVAIQVKSTDPWEVYSNNKEWCTITPAEGEAGKLYDVVVTYNPNVNLDDRIDTITIKSDYWIGKEVPVIQKGTAYLELEDADNLFIAKDENSTDSFKILSNQKWTTKVTQGEEWLSITAGENGELNGSVTVRGKENKGEKRYGNIAVYDRHGVLLYDVKCTQDGAQLDPATFSIRADYKAQKISIPVVANTQWVVTKDDEEAEWYTFEQVEFDGSSELVIILKENKISSVLKASFTLSTKKVEGVTPVTRQIILKQSNNQIPKRQIFDNPADWTVNNGTIAFNEGLLTASVGRVKRDGFAPGYYSFHIKSMTSNAQSTLFFTYGALEVRWHLNMGTGKTNYSTAPYTPVVERNKVFDKTLKSYTIGLNLVASPTQAGMMKIEWYLDGKLMDSYDNTGNAKFSMANALIYLGSNAGTVLYDWWEYTAPIDWGE